MAGSRELLQLRAELSRYREQKSRGKYPSELRERAEAYARERTRVGATPTEIATELGVHKMTAYCRPVSLMLQPLASSMLRDGEELYAARMAIMEGARSSSLDEGTALIGRRVACNRIWPGKRRGLRSGYSC